MPSPFPGMDPYLEDPRLWPGFHHDFMTCLFRILLPGLTERYDAHLGERRYTTQSPSGLQEHREQYIEVRERSSGKPVTLIDVVSPANKTTAEGRKAYIDKRNSVKDTGANLVEIDLVLQGQPTLEYSRDGLPDWDYAVTVTRASEPERYEIYTATLQKRLPRFRLPLAADDRDTVLDLQAGFARCYDQQGYAARIDYTRPPAVPLNDSDGRWVAQLLGHPLPEDIALAAYYLWLKEGCPHGRDVEHWQKAMEQLKPARPT